MPLVLGHDAWVELPAVKGSRFIGHAEIVHSNDEARAVLQRLRKAHPKARHHCVAWRLADGTLYRNDDGEPSGTAGPPILQRLETGDVIDAVVVVVRYFGGVKLGTGGLARAYGDAAQAALDAAEPRPLVRTRRLRLNVDYARHGPVQHLLGDRAREFTYGADVSVLIEVTEVDAPSLLATLAERWNLHPLPLP